MTKEQIDIIFPPSYGGNAQVSDLRLLLSILSESGEMGGDFYEVVSIQERDNLIGVPDASICKVQGDTTYIYDVTGAPQKWKKLIDNIGGVAPSGSELTENVLVNSIDEQNQYLDIQYVPDTNQHVFVFLNGMYLMLGTNLDYTLSGNRINFDHWITTGDHIAVKYTKS